MPDSRERIGIAADHAGFEAKEYLAGKLREADYEVVDFGDSKLKLEDDDTDFVVPGGPRSCSPRTSRAWPSAGAE